MRTRERVLAGVVACTLGLSLGLGAAPVRAEESSAAGQELGDPTAASPQASAEEQTSAQLDAQATETLQDSAVGQEAASSEPAQEAAAQDVPDPNLPGGFVGSEEGAHLSLRGDEYGVVEGALAAQASDGAILANHPEWTALGLFQYIVSQTADGTPEHEDAELAVKILRGTDDLHSMDVASSIDFTNYYDAVSLDSIDQSLVFIDQYNAHRARENREEGTKLSTNVGTNCRMLAISIAQCDWSKSRIEHSGAFNVGENLAWGSSTPFLLWYDEEKKVYQKTKQWSSETGHYLNIVDPNTKLTGFAVCQNDSLYGITCEQSFESWVEGDEPIYQTSEFYERWLGPYYREQWRSGYGAAVADMHYGVNFHADSKGNLTRYWGENALDTMQAVVRTDGVYNTYGGTMILATADDYYDALAASGLAGVLGAPIVITHKDELNTQARSEIMRLQPDRILVMGGPAAIQEKVLTDYMDLSKVDVKRVYGQTAIDTAVAIYEQGKGSWGKTAVVATSTGYWDALSIAPYAYAKKAPIFLTGSDNKLGSSALNALRAGGFERVVIVGGSLVVSSDVEAQLKSAGIGTVKRLAGTGAIETSADIAKWAIGSEGMNAQHIAVATINGYWDALTAAPVCGRQGSVLVLADKDRMGAVVTARQASPAGGFAHVHVIGGTIALPDSVWQWLLSNAPKK